MKAKKWIGLFCTVLMLTTLLAGCNEKKEAVRVGVSFGVGAAERWGHEKEYMEEYAKELGVEIEVRLNKTDEPKTQQEDCFEMIDSGIDVLILTPRDVNKTSEILAYAKEKQVPVINYARVLLGDKPDLYVGYDSSRIGEQQGKYVAELVTQGDYIILRGDQGDYNSQLVYDGVLKSLTPIQDNIRIILDEFVQGWSVDEAKRMVKEAVAANGNKVDAILAPNDKLAGASADALAELGVTSPVVIVGMDAELDAARRIVEGTQAATIYMDLKVLAHTAVDEAIRIGRGEQVTVNAEFDNKSGEPIASNLITGELVTKANLDKMLIDSGCFTREEVYE